MTSRAASTHPLYSVQGHLFDSDTHHFFILTIGCNLRFTPSCYFSKAKAIAQLQDIIDELYQAHDRAIENNDFDDASLLASRADRLYQEAENLEIVITELEDK
ncbi:hypothetical protein [Calothrix sp. PCC 7507]|uniref:hypothetical protein n=1 Tax=Calothrix sp. PCC 7507 TaxID=99598 RepID=UPI00029ECBD0|nr:hypothetical protein [Calothrix sp. PCC 7507]AFY34174.1 hypothetical protein Cal7507_3785 [Calothrix sp. PCC 7507]